MTVLNPLPPPPPRQRGRFQPFKWGAAVISAITSDMAGAIRVFEFLVIAGGGFALSLFAFWNLARGDFSSLAFLYGIALFEGGGLILVGIGSFRWPGQTRSGHRVPKSRYVGEICLGVGLCLPWMSHVLGFPPASDLPAWLVGIVLIGSGFILFTVLQELRRRLM